jgi:hypothetical protein
MKNFILAVLLVLAFLILAQVAEAQVYVPGSGPTICQPRQVPTPNGIVTIIVCS